MKTVKTLVLFILTISLVSCNNQGPNVKSLDTAIDSVSYAIGLDMALKLKANFNEVNQDVFVQGFKNGMDSVNLLIQEKDIRIV